MPGSRNAAYSPGIILHHEPSLIFTSDDEVSNLLIYGHTVSLINPRDLYTIEIVKKLEI